MIETTARTTTQCGHLEALADLGVIRFGMLMNVQTQLSRFAPIIDQLKQGKDGVLRKTKDCAFLEVLHCPLCGEKTKTPEAQENGDGSD